MLKYITSEYKTKKNSLTRKFEFVGKNGFIEKPNTDVDLTEFDIDWKSFNQKINETEQCIIMKVKTFYFI